MANVGDDPKAATDAANEMFEAIPKSKRMEFIGHLNEVLVYISSHAPKVERS